MSAAVAEAVAVAVAVMQKTLSPAVLVCLRAYVRVYKYMAFLLDKKSLHTISYGITVKRQ